MVEKMMLSATNEEKETERKSVTRPQAVLLCFNFPIPFFAKSPPPLVEVYNGTKWQQPPPELNPPFPFPAPDIYGFGLQAADGGRRLYFFGGQKLAEDEPSLHFTWALDLESLAAQNVNINSSSKKQQLKSANKLLPPPTLPWKVKAPMIQARHSFASVVVEEEEKEDSESEDCKKTTKAIYVFGGKYLHLTGEGTNKHRLLNTCERYDLQTDLWSSIAPLRYARGSSATATVWYAGQNSSKTPLRIYVSGGLDVFPDYNNLKAIVEVYDPQANVWQNLATPMSSPRSCFALATLQGRVWALGGFTLEVKNIKKFASAESLDPVTGGVWRREAPLIDPLSRSGHRAVLFNGGQQQQQELLLVGGNTGDNSTFWTDQYDPVKRRWARVAPISYRHWRHQLAVVPAHLAAPFIAGVSLDDDEEDLTESYTDEEEEDDDDEEEIDNETESKNNSAKSSRYQKAYPYVIVCALLELATALYYLITSTEMLTTPFSSFDDMLSSFNGFLFTLLFLLLPITVYFFAKWANKKRFQEKEEEKKEEEEEEEDDDDDDDHDPEAYRIDRFHAISLAYYNFDAFNRNLIKIHPNAGALTEEDMEEIKNFQVGPLPGNRQCVAEFERTLRRAKFTVASLPETASFCPQLFGGGDQKTAAKTKAFLKAELAKIKPEEKVCLLIYISSHGVDGAFHCSDLLFRIKDITQMLKECEALADQPKVLIVDTCRVTEDEVNEVSWAEQDAEPLRATEDIGDVLEEIEQKRGLLGLDDGSEHLLTAYSCLKTYVSYTNHGGLFTQKLIEVLNEYCFSAEEGETSTANDDDGDFPVVVEQTETPKPTRSLWLLLTEAQERAGKFKVPYGPKKSPRAQPGFLVKSLTARILLHPLEAEDKDREKWSCTVI